GDLRAVGAGEGHDLEMREDAAAVFGREAAGEDAVDVVRHRRMRVAEQMRRSADLFLGEERFLVVTPLSWAIRSLGTPSASARMRAAWGRLTAARADGPIACTDCSQNNVF